MRNRLFFPAHWLSLLIVYLFALTTLGKGIKDYRSREVKLHKKPRKIASATLASDEILWLILQETEALHRLLAVSVFADNTQYSNIADQVKKTVPYRIGKSTENLVNAAPDLAILASFNRPDLIKKIEQIGIKTFVLPEFRKIKDIFQAINTIGTLIHEEEAAKVVTRKFKEGIKTLSQAGKKLKEKPRVLGWAPNGTVSGCDTLFHDFVEIAGGHNVLNDYSIRGWPRLSKELMLNLDPEIVVVSGNSDDRDEILKNLAKEPYTKNWSAVKQKKIVVIPARYLSTPSPYAVNGIKKLQIEIFNFAGQPRMSQIESLPFQDTEGLWRSPNAKNLTQASESLLMGLTLDSSNS